MISLALLGAVAMAVAYAYTWSQLRRERVHAATLRNAVALSRFARTEVTGGAG